MKNALRLLALLLTLSALAPLRAQEPPDAEPLPPFERFRNKAQKAQEDALFQIEKAKQQVGEVRDQLTTILRRPGDVSGPALVVRTSDTDAKTQASLEEDLAVMF